MESSQRRPITRNRELLACTECRRRKLRCDRHTPCSACARRGDETSCTYQRSANGFERERERRLQAEARLENLEWLVQTIAQQGDSLASAENITSPSAVDQHTNGEVCTTASGAFGSKSLVFNGSTHWSAMLEDIEGLRSVIMPEKANISDDEMREYEEDSGHSLILGSGVPIPLEKVLSLYLPPRQDADRLIAAYFRSRGVSAPFIHGPSFRRRYQEFWEDPSKAPVLWVSILFSICHIARNTLALGKENVYAENRYDLASAHCLAIGEYFRPKQYSIESLLLFAQAKCLTGLGISHDVGLIFGLLVRLATRMGYHRDPSIFQLSAFESEMRRRTWSLCMQLDLLISFHLGLPSNIQYPTWDTTPPKNLQDSDFDEDIEELPRARPDSDLTDIQFYIAKHKLMAIFEKVLRHSLTTGIDVSAEVDALDSEIRTVYGALPEILHPLPMTDSTVDSPSLVVTRLCVFFLYQNCLCVLHRPYVTQGRVHSMQVCGDAASNIVRYINDTYDEFRPGGQLETERWFLSSITWHDYLLGVTALCLVLCASSQNTAMTEFQSTEVIKLLRRARDICMDQAVRSKDIGRVQNVVDATLLRFENLENHAQETRMNESIPSMSSFGPSVFYASLDGHQGDTGNDMLSQLSQDVPPRPTASDWADSDFTGFSIDDTSWAYLGQFLNLSSGDLMPS